MKASKHEVRAADFISEMMSRGIVSVDRDEALAILERIVTPDPKAWKRRRVTRLGISRAEAEQRHRRYLYTAWQHVRSVLCENWSGPDGQRFTRAVRTEAGEYRHYITLEPELISQANRVHARSVECQTRRIAVSAALMRGSTRPSNVEMADQVEAQASEWTRWRHEDAARVAAEAEAVAAVM